MIESELITNGGTCKTRFGGGMGDQHTRLQATAVVVVPRVVSIEFQQHQKHKQHQKEEAEGVEG
jgi:hypothetical protein